MTGVNSPGIAHEARTASRTLPSRSQISRPESSSVAIAPYVTGISEISRSSKMVRNSVKRRVPRIRPPRHERSISRTTVVQASPVTQFSSRSSSPEA